MNNNTNLRRKNQIFYSFSLSIYMCVFKVFKRSPHNHRLLTLLKNRKFDEKQTTLSVISRKFNFLFQ